MIAADEDRLERGRDNIDAAENEYVKYADMITDKKNKLEMLTSKENELVERTKIAENVYDMFRHGGDDDVREKLIDGLNFFLFGAGELYRRLWLRLLLLLFGQWHLPPFPFGAAAQGQSKRCWFGRASPLAG